MARYLGQGILPRTRHAAKAKVAPHGTLPRTRHAAKAFADINGSGIKRTVL